MHYPFAESAVFVRQQAPYFEVHLTTQLFAFAVFLSNEHLTNIKKNEKGLNINNNLKDYKIGNNYFDKVLPPCQIFLELLQE